MLLKPGKIRSPSPAAKSKSSKSFMSPTISASFKVAESPRRKILAERNETAHSSDHKIHVRKVTVADPLEQKRLDVSIDGNENPSPSFESDDMSSENLSDSDVASLIPSDDLLFENMHVPANSHLIPQNEIHTFDNVYLSPPAATPPVSYTHTVVDPLDADPSITPYDPKTNYLSPRPQFLHYRPKPQIELEDKFIMSASFSDSEVTEDTQSEESLKESEDVSSGETLKQEEDQISEPSPVRTLLPEESVEEKDLPKSRFSLWSKAVAQSSVQETTQNRAVIKKTENAFESSMFLLQ
ncbi:hypothetical protein KIW84_022443 [Lathyrus oleraceus]|uniref:Uncharacterized protein n=1 Tax=Pisum sativum TaxID=3888 RepID=A0A9D5BAS0_PEA|nr:hypothetical protein KIW84_022443 [Pisum sativum]